LQVGSSEETAMTVPNRISIVTFGVADLDRASAFYESLGWTRSAASMPSITFFDTVGPVFGLYEWSALADDARVPPDGSGFRGVTLAMNLASTDEVDAVFAEWLAAGRPRSSNRTRRSGAGTRRTSPTSTGTCGSSPTTRTHDSTTTDASSWGDGAGWRRQRSMISR
jgi:hypothetical protein